MSTNSAKSRRNKKKKEQKKSHHKNSVDAKINRLSPDGEIVLHILSFLDIYSVQNIIHATNCPYTSSLIIINVNGKQTLTSKQFKICLPIKRYYQWIFRFIQKEEESFELLYFIYKGQEWKWLKHNLFIHKYLRNISQIEKIHPKELKFIDCHRKERLDFIKYIFEICMISTQHEFDYNLYDKYDDFNNYVQNLINYNF